MIWSDFTQLEKDRINSAVFGEAEIIADAL